MARFKSIRTSRKNWAVSSSIASTPWASCGTSKRLERRGMSGSPHDLQAELNIRVDRLDAPFEATRFVPARPDLDPGRALDHLVRRIDVGVRRVTHGTTVRVHLSSEPVTAELQSTAVAAVGAYCRRRADECRAT